MPRAYDRQMPVPVPDAGFTEVAPRIWVARYASWDVNVTVVEGERGLVVVDTMGSDETVQVMRDDLRRLSRRDVVAVVNTHEHFDHVHGNASFQADRPGLPVHAHEDAVVPTATERFSSVSFVDLGAYHTIVGVIIASCKAALVFLFFMHLLYSTRLTWVIVLGALFWLGIILVLTMSDYWTRHLLTTP